MTYVGTTDTDWLLEHVERLARSWKPLVFGTVTLTGAALLLVLLFSKPTYTARMIVPLSPQVEALISAGIVGSGLSVSRELAPHTRLFAVSISGTDPEAVQSELKRAFEQIIAASKPSPSLRLRILSSIESNNAALAELRGLKESKSTAIRNEIENLEARASQLHLQLDGVRPDEVPEPPGKAIQSWRPISIRTVIVALLGSLLVTSLFVLARARR